MKRWDKNLWLLTLEEFNQLPYGVQLQCVTGLTVIKGLNFVDDDTRGGCLAYGLTKELANQQGSKTSF